MSFQAADKETGSLPLTALPLVALDSETTGLNVAEARVIQIGALRITASRIETQAPFETLVDPGVPIPPRTTVIHGITDRDVAGAELFSPVMSRLADWVGSAVVVGYAIGFDLAILKAEHERAGSDWRAPRSLDLRHLVQILAPPLPDFSLEVTAAWLGIEVVDRHRALGDARLAAQIFIALLPRLRAKGILTLAQAERACRGLTQQMETEAAAGWVEVGRSLPPLPASVRAYARIDSFPYRHRLCDIMSRPPAVLGAEASLEEALALLMDRKISSVFFSALEPERQAGILTERDILRALETEGAAALARPAGDFVQRPLVALEEEEFVYRALVTMGDRGFRHLGVTDAEGRLVGALSARDLLRQRAGEAVSLGDAIDKADSAESLGAIWRDLTTVVRGLVQEEVDARDIAAVISRELRALTRRACEIAEADMAAAGKGRPPQAYALLVLGSGGRGESLLAMDQDNAIVYRVDARDGSADRWFAHLGKRIADILDAAGVAYCKGGVMASNPAWRHDLAGWRVTIDDWIQRAGPEDLLHSDIYFDCRPVFGDRALADELYQEALALAKGSRKFLQFLALNAAEFQSPLGLFGRFRLSDGRMDLKAGGLMPLFSMVRVLALKDGISARATPARLEKIRALSPTQNGFLDDLLEAHRILLDSILKQQLLDLQDGLTLGNSVDPAALSGHQRQELRWALEQVKTAVGLLDLPLGL